MTDEHIRLMDIASRAFDEADLLDTDRLLILATNGVVYSFTGNIGDNLGALRLLNQVREDIMKGMN